MYITTSYNLCSIYTYSTENFKLILFLCTHVYSHVSWKGAPPRIVVHLVLECLLYNYARDTYSSIFHNVISWSQKSFFQLDHDVDISFYLTKAIGLYHSSKLVISTPSWCIFTSTRFFWGVLGFLFDWFHFISLLFVYNLNWPMNKLGFCARIFSWDPTTSRFNVVREGQR